MEFRVLKYFLMTARLGSMTKAAQSLHITQPTLSHDMKVLVESGLIIDRRDGKNIFYSLNPEALKEFHTIMGEIFKNKLHCVCDGHDSHERKAAGQP